MEQSKLASRIATIFTLLGLFGVFFIPELLKNFADQGALSTVSFVSLPVALILLAVNWNVIRKVTDKSIPLDRKISYGLLITFIFIVIYFALILIQSRS